MNVNKCHFCGEELDLNNAITYSCWGYTNLNYVRCKLFVCSKHWRMLYEISYSLNVESFIPERQREYLGVKRLEEELNIKDRV